MINIDSGISPKGKAQDFDSCIVGSNPTIPVVKREDGE